MIQGTPAFAGVTDVWGLRRVVKRRVSEPREPVALFQERVDLVAVLLAVAWRPAGTQGTPALRTALLFGTGLPACEPQSGIIAKIGQRQARDGDVHGLSPNSSVTPAKAGVP